LQDLILALGVRLCYKLLLLGGHMTATTKTGKGGSEAMAGKDKYFIVESSALRKYF
jgi:hypothetical protein